MIIRTYVTARLRAGEKYVLKKYVDSRGNESLARCSLMRLACVGITRAEKWRCVTVYKYLMLCTKKTGLIPVAVSKKETTTNETRKKTNRQTKKNTSQMSRFQVHEYNWSDSLLATSSCRCVQSALISSTVQFDRECDRFIERCLLVIVF